MYFRLKLDLESGPDGLITRAIIEKAPVMENVFHESVITWYGLLDPEHRVVTGVYRIPCVVTDICQSWIRYKTPWMSLKSCHWPWTWLREGMTRLWRSTWPVWHCSSSMPMRPHRWHSKIHSVIVKALSDAQMKKGLLGTPGNYKRNSSIHSHFQFLYNGAISKQTWYWNIWHKFVSISIKF